MSLPAALQPPPSVARIARFLEELERRHRGVLPTPMVTGDVASFTEWIGTLVRPTPVRSETEAVRDATRPTSVAEPDLARPPVDTGLPEADEIEREVRVHELIERSETVRLEQGLLRRPKAPPVRPAEISMSEIVQVYPTFATYLLTSGKGAVGTMGVADAPTAPSTQAWSSFGGAPMEAPGNVLGIQGTPMPLAGPSPLPPSVGNAVPVAGSPGEVAVRPPIGFAWNEPVRRDVLGAFGGPARAEGFTGVALGEDPIGLVDPLLGQITLVAPPVRAEVPGGGAVEFAWRDMGRGIGPLDEGQMEVLRTALPEGTRALYPAIPRERLGGNAVNLRIAPSVVQTLVERGYGDRRLVDVPTVVRRAQDFHGGTPAAMPLPARPVTGSLPERARRRQRTLDVAGGSFELATTLGGATETRHLAIARLGFADLPRAPILNVTGFDRFDRRVLGRFNRLDPAPVGPSRGILALPSVSVPALAQAARHAPSFATAGSVSGREAATTLPLLASLIVSRSAPGAPARGLTGIATRTAPSSPVASSALPYAAPSAAFSPAASASPSARAVVRPTFGAASRLSGAPARPVAPRVAPKPSIGPIGFNATIGRSASPDAPKVRPGSPATSSTAARTTPGAGAVTSPPRFGGSMGTPSSAGLRTATPAIPAPVLPPRFAEATNFRESHVAAPVMALPAARHAEPMEPAEPVMVQASTGGASPAQATAPAFAASLPKGGLPGGAGSEVNALANEVWTLLKRRLAFENQRAGGR